MTNDVNVLDEMRGVLCVNLCHKYLSPSSGKGIHRDQYCKSCIVLNDGPNWYTTYGRIWMHDY